MSKLDEIKPSKCISLETYKKDNQPIKTPVWFIIKNNLVYVVTRSKTGKVKRLENNLQVKIAPCTFKGKITGNWISGTAKILDEKETKEIVKLRDKKYGFMAKVAKFFSKNKGELYAFSININ
ncbi:MAG: PPOX class F420-dependent oxidoreductase [Nitrosopumilus sp.]|nr:PPOX class F420-dependent oxidoreductase [Nitrosopumilus sp.]NNL37927.1 PPOX class F420-dependent oxidoreductase [Nitrosopumilus sp.]NNM36280.1 PPOX class F420-dependent oxidoreductase [Nitrosopumilus sp.]